MKVQLTAPSKTFLVGEYAVLEGGPALVASTEPRFSLTVQTGGEGLCQNIHMNSPAGQWARRFRDIFQNVDVSFQDPHEGRGGFGASSAQYLLLWAWSQLEHKPFSKLGDGVDVAELLKDYQGGFQDFKNRPSGADVVAQCVGGLSLITTSPLSVQSKPWPWAQLDFLIVPTGFKLPTHDHLQATGREGFDELVDCSKEACAALAQGQENAFLTGINRYRELLKCQKRLATHTEKLIERWLNEPGVFAAKGCGALGADSFVLFVDREKSLAIRGLLENEGRPVLASSLSLSNGLGLQMEMQSEAKSLLIKSPSLVGEWK